MRVVVIGLGIMGASYASMLTKLGYEVYAIEKDETRYLEALKDKIILDDTFNNNLSKADIIINTLYPIDVIKFLKDNESLLNENQLITDIAGVKNQINDFVTNEFKYKENYVSHHPMCGRESRLKFFHDDSMFKNSNCIIIENKLTNRQFVKKLELLLEKFKFKQFIKTSALKHDSLIGYTSQLAHAIALALVNSNSDELTIKATGDSFRDLTRIAKINENLWSELFLENKELLIDNIDNFINELTILKNIIETKDEEKLKSYMKDGHERRKKFDWNWC